MDQKNLYELISRHFMATISPDAKFYKKKVVFSAGPHSFNLKGTACVDPGFLSSNALPELYLRAFQRSLTCALVSSQF